MEFESGIDWLHILLIVALGAFVWWGIGRAAHYVGSRLAVGDIDTEKEKRAATLVRAVRQLFGTVLALIVLMLVLSEFGISITPLLGAAGVAGIALGLGAQTLAKDFLRGFALLFDNQIRVGDEVEIAGRLGKVEALSTRSVTLRGQDGAVHFIPASEIKSVTNRSYGHVYAQLEIGIAGDADAERVIAILRETATELRADPLLADAILEDAEVEGIDRWTRDTVYLKARLRTRPGKDRSVCREWRSRVHARLAREGIESQA